MAGDGRGDFAVEILHDLLIIHMVRQFFGGNRIDERQQHLFRRKIILDNSERITLLAPRRMIGHDRCGFEEPQGFQSNQFGVAGADAQAEQSAFRRHYSRSEASALTAAAVMALPPRRPRTIT